jgi:hypothetical protein
MSLSSVTIGRNRYPLMQTPALKGTQVGLPGLRIKKPISGRSEIGAQFQLWIFSYTNLPARSKKRLSRLMIGFGAIAPDFAEPVLGLADGKTRGLHPGYT